MPRRKNQSDISFRIKFITIMGVVVMATFMGSFLWKNSVDYLYASNSFRVEKIVVDPALHFIKRQDINRLYGVNIFEVDLKGVQNTMLYKYPQIDDIRVTRQFPNQISFMATRRDPIAQFLMNEKTVTIDENGYVLSLVSKLNGKLPIIENLSLNKKPQLGMPLRDDDLLMALDVLSFYLDERELFAYKLKSIDVSNPTKIIVRLANDINILIDKHNLEKKMAVLGFVMNQGQLNFDELAYIDLRFKEPVIGKK